MEAKAEEASELLKRFDTDLEALDQNIAFKLMMSEIEEKFRTVQGTLVVEDDQIEIFRHQGSARTLANVRLIPTYIRSIFLQKLEVPNGD